MVLKKEDTMNELLKGIETAIQEEIAAQEKYKELKKQAEGDETKALFDQLIRDEKVHEKILKSRYKAIEESMK